MSPRTPDQLVAALAAAAGLTDFDAERSWADVLFDTTAAPVLSGRGQPDRELLAALADEWVHLDEHVATLGQTTRRAWLENLLGIPRLPVLPDRVVAHATVDPKLAPAILPPGTVLRGGKDAFGNERRYTTIDALTAHGAALTGVRSFVPGGVASGRPGVAAAAPDFPLRPDGSGDARWDAAHRLRIHSPTLAFGTGDMTVVVDFAGVTEESTLGALIWHWPRPDGTVSAGIPGTVAGSSLTIAMSGGCGTADGSVPWVEGRLTSTAAVPTGLSFTGVAVQVSSRSPFVPQAAFYNDGVVDVTKEFQPYGAVAKRGDAFFIRSDEAFGKPLATVTISVQVMQAGGAAPLSSSIGGSGLSEQLSVSLKEAVDKIGFKLGGTLVNLKDEFDGFYKLITTTTAPSVQWQRRVGGQWIQFGSAASSFGSVTGNVAGAVGSEPFSVAGQRGNYVRAFLAAGDFGWTEYQRKVAAFASAAVGATTPKVAMPQVPVPPIASSVTLSYTTSAEPATRVESTTGWRQKVKPASAARFHPFQLRVDEGGSSGMVAVGLELPDAATGSSVSLWFEADSAAPCGASDDVEAAWQWWDGAAWQPLAVADGSRQLREAGLLRFVAPVGWAVGCPEVSAPSGKWVRLVTTAPERLGVVRDVILDAVVAEFVSTAADPSTDPSPETALPAGTIKGTLTPARGVKKVTNIASVRGRGPESESGYLDRASALVRHRNRAIMAWDYEQHVLLSFPEVEAVRCLPHTGPDGTRSPGTVGLVVVPDRPTDPAPLPSVSLVGRVVSALEPVRPIGADVVVLCPDYRAVRVVASIRLRRGIAALVGKEAVGAALETFLHPTGTVPTRWGIPLWATSVIAFLERHPSVDVVTQFALRDDTGVVEVVEVDPCRGLYCSSGRHDLTCEEQL